MRTERVAVILVEIQNPAAGTQVFRLFDVFEKLQSVPDDADGSEKFRAVMEIVTDERQHARVDNGIIYFTTHGSSHDHAAKPRVFLAVRAVVHRELQTMLGGTHGFYG